jgi:hypothetical protein
MPVHSGAAPVEANAWLADDDTARGGAPAGTVVTSGTVPAVVVVVTPVVVVTGVVEVADVPPTFVVDVEVADVPETSVVVVVAPVDVPPVHGVVVVV